MTSESRSPGEIEREIERERAGLTNTLDDLQDRFSLESISRQVTDQFREHGGDIGRSVSDAVKRNPVALALTGAGLAWLMLGDRTSGARYERERRVPRFDDHDDGYDADRVSAAQRAAGSATHRDIAARTARDQSAYRRAYYAGSDGARRELPSWAKPSAQKQTGVGEKMRDSASSAGESVSQAASSAAESVSNAGSTVASKARGAASAVSEAGKSVADRAQGLAASASDSAAEMRERLAAGTEQLSEEARERVIAARRSAIEARDAALTYARRGGERAVDLFEEQPLIGGALAVAVGAALGAALPRSRIEDSYLGEQSDHLMEEAERIFEEEKRKLGKVAKAATSEARKVAEEAMDSADSAAEAAIDKASETGERIADAAEAEAEKQDLGGAVKKKL